MWLHRALSLVVALVGLGGLVPALLDYSAVGVIVFGALALVGVRNFTR